MVRGIRDKDDLEKHLEDVLESYLSFMSFEDFLEYLDITPLEIFMCAWESGLVDEERLENSQ